AEAVDHLARLRVERVEVARHRGEDARLVPVAPVRDATVRTAGGDAGVELPDEAARGRIEGDDLVARRVGVDDAVDHDRLRLQPAGLAGVVRPGDLELVHVVAGD